MTVAARCDACVLVEDDRGNIRDYCERPKGHRGEHARTLGATKPLAKLRWFGTYKDPT